MAEVIPRPVAGGNSQAVVLTGENGHFLVPRVGTLLASAARTTTTTSAAQINPGFPGVRVRVNISSITDTPSITVTIQEQDSISGNWIDMLSSAAYTTQAQQASIMVYPGCVAVANVVLNQPLPRVWRISVAHADTDSATYSADFAYCV